MLPISSVHLSSNSRLLHLEELIVRIPRQKDFGYKRRRKIRTMNIVSITFGSCDPKKVLKSQPVKEGKWELRIINTEDIKEKVCNMVA